MDVDAEGSVLFDAGVRVVGLIHCDTDMGWIRIGHADPGHRKVVWLSRHVSPHQRAGHRIKNTALFNFNFSHSIPPSKVSVFGRYCIGLLRLTHPSLWPGSNQTNLLIFEE